MKSCLLILLPVLIISCKNENSSLQKSNQKPNPKTTIAYYQPDYANHIDTILNSGENGKKSSEAWGLNKSEIKKLPEIKTTKIDYNKVISIAKQHLNNRFDPIDLEFQSIELEVLNKNTTNKFNYLVVTFSYDKKKYVQKVPLLLDGRVILSNNE